MPELGHTLTRNLQASILPRLLVPIYWRSTVTDPTLAAFVATTGAELARHPDEPRVSSAVQVDAWMDVISAAIEKDELDVEVRRIAGTLLGCLILARAMPELAISDAFLDSGRKAALARIRSRR